MPRPLCLCLRLVALTLVLNAAPAFGQIPAARLNSVFPVGRGRGRRSSARSPATTSKR